MLTRCPWLQPDPTLNFQLLSAVKNQPFANSALLGVNVAMVAGFLKPCDVMRITFPVDGIIKKTKTKTQLAHLTLVGSKYGGSEVNLEGKQNPA